MSTESDKNMFKPWHARIIIHRLGTKVSRAAVASWLESMAADLRNDELEFGKNVSFKLMKEKEVNNPDTGDSKEIHITRDIEEKKEETKDDKKTTKKSDGKSK